MKMYVSFEESTADSVYADLMGVPPLEITAMKTTNHKNSNE